MFRKAKKLIIVGAVLVVLLLGGLFYVLLNMDSLIKDGIEKVMTYVLEVDVTLDDVDVSPLKGEIILQGLSIGNPTGFNTEKAIGFEEIIVSADLKSFSTDEPTIKIVSITNPKITLEQGLRRSNLSELLKSASRFQSDTPAEEAVEEEKAPEGVSKKIKLEKMVITGAEVGFSAPLLQGAEATYKLDTIELTNLGGTDGTTPADILSIFISTILQASVTQGSNFIPSEAFAELQTGAFDALDDFKSSLISPAEQLQSAVDQAGEDVKGALEGLQQGISGILGGDKTGGDAKTPTPTPDVQGALNKVGDEIKSGIGNIRNSLGGLLGGDKQTPTPTPTPTPLPLLK